MSVVLGLNGAPLVGHDASAALVVDGEIVASVEEERLSRSKRAMSQHPEGALREVLRLAGLHFTDVDLIAIPWVPEAMGFSSTELEGALRSWTSGLDLDNHATVGVRFVPHHLAHAYSGLCFAETSFEGRAVRALILDGTGECVSGAAYDLSRPDTPLWQLGQTGSLGIYYEAVTEYLGFSWGDEGKVMGLAAYGRPGEFDLPEMPDTRSSSLPKIWPKNSGSTKHRHERIRRGLVDRFRVSLGTKVDFQTAADIAHAVQIKLQARVLSYVDELCSGAEVLIYSGGFALNCAINRQVALLCRARGVELVIPPVASDTGVALGAAVEGALQLGERVTPTSVYLGRAPLVMDLAAVARQEFGLTVRAVAPEVIAEDLYYGDRVYGWCDGRAEVGPRSLGGRSIIARCDSARLRDRINALKGREIWRPLAPSSSIQAFEDYFHGECPSLYMIIAAKAADPANPDLAGVVHVDGTARPQVVENSGPYKDLLKAVGKLTGRAMVTCTSFNKAGEPMVYSVRDVIRTALELGLDGVAGDGFCIEMKSSNQ